MHLLYMQVGAEVSVGRVPMEQKSFLINLPILVLKINICDTVRAKLICLKNACYMQTFSITSLNNNIHPSHPLMCME